jgi:hypothetical protein
MPVSDRRKVPTRPRVASNLRASFTACGDGPACSLRALTPTGALRGVGGGAALANQRRQEVRWTNPTLQSASNRAGPSY